MELLNFINAHENWQELLSFSPYNISISTDPTNTYYLLKYNSLNCNFNLKLVQECRGCIVRQNPETSIWISVCHAMDKFGNYGESYAVTPLIDWSKGVDVQEKIDGSLIKVWFDEGDWHISTNGTIAAKDAVCGNTNFEQLFLDLIPDVHNFFSNLRPCYTYWFELVNPEFNPIVVKYDEKHLYALGCRNMVTDEEEDFPIQLLEHFPWLCVPKHYRFYSLEEVVAACAKMGADEEGYVCVGEKKDNNFLRIKVKGNEYLKLHHLRGNGPLTIKRIVEMWQTECLDDFQAYFLMYNQTINKVVAFLHDFIFSTENFYAELQRQQNLNLMSRKEFAQQVQMFPPIMRPYMFARLDNKVMNATTYYKNISAEKLSKIIQIGGNY